MKKSNLYTRTGDQGTTSLVGGTRARKNSTRLEAYGTLDEFSSHLGCVLSHKDCPPDEKNFLLGVQNMLFNLGGYLASESPSAEEATASDPDALPPVWGLTQDDLSRLESHIDSLDAETPKVNAFVLPGGTELSAMTHVARTVCRRAERKIVTLSETDYVDPLLLSYMNRLSDYLFILARYFNHLAGVEEIIWHK